MIADASNDAAFCAKLEAALLDDLRTTSIQGANSRISLAVQDADGLLRAGLSGTTSYGWLRVNMLWVSADHRRSGMGSQLMHDAIELSLERGCHAAWLETSNPQARAFMRILVLKPLPNWQMTRVLYPRATRVGSYAAP
jgi:GNAT superfamily N-acetyltransferase